jgi:hypothetical protein
MYVLCKLYYFSISDPYFLGFPLPPFLKDCPHMRTLIPTLPCLGPFCVCQLPPLAFNPVFETVIVVLIVIYAGCYIALVLHQTSGKEEL